MRTIFKHRLVWPIGALLALIVLNTISRPSFLSITVKDGELYGSLIDILRNSAPLMLIALGMTLVIATRGIDLSVGAQMAISGAVALTIISGSGSPNSLGTVSTAILTAVVIGLLFGLWNGFLVAILGIQPIIATLVLMVAGRGIAQLITSGQITTINSDPSQVFGAGYWLALPFSIFIAHAADLGTGALSRRTALGMLLESVGGNAEASRLAGTRSRSLILLAYVFSGLCAGIAGVLIASNVNSADGNNAGLWIELDAILAVVIGGTALPGGRYYLAGTLVGALVIQTLTTTIYSIGIPPETTLLFKALVVTVVCLLQSPAFRAKVFTRRRKPTVAPARPNLETKTEVPA